MTATPPADLAHRVAGFAGALRAAGVRPALGDEIDALRALQRADLDDRHEQRRVLACTLRIRPGDTATFEGLFERLWRRDDPRPDHAPRPAHGPGHPKPPARAAPSAPRPGDGLGQGGTEARPESDEPGWSREALLRKKPFDRCDDDDLVALERLLVRLAARLVTRRGRRLAPTHGRGQVDLRRSLRGALATDGELLRLAHRARPLAAARLVLLCDTSGSMDGHARFLVTFVRALRRAAPGTEVFAFNTGLTRITRWLAAAPLRATLDRLAEAVPDWSGGTRLGESLEAFATSHLVELVDRRTVVLVLSDGLDRGDPALVASAMERIRARARRVLWLNPLAADPRYQPTARAMAAALPFVDRLAPVHDLDSLERLLPHLASHKE